MRVTLPCTTGAAFMLGSRPATAGDKGRTRIGWCSLLMCTQGRTGGSGRDCKWVLGLAGFRALTMEESEIHQDSN